MKQKRPTLFISQYGDRYWACSVKELKWQVGRGRVFKIYRDKPDGSTVHTGYGVGKLWFDAYIPLERAVA